MDSHSLILWEIPHPFLLPGLDPDPIKKLHTNNTKTAPKEGGFFGISGNIKKGETNCYTLRSSRAQQDKHKDNSEWLYITGNNSGEMTCILCMEQAPPIPWQTVKAVWNRWKAAFIYTGTFWEKGTPITWNSLRYGQLYKHRSRIQTERPKQRGGGSPYYLFTVGKYSEPVRGALSHSISFFE